MDIVGWKNKKPVFIASNNLLCNLTIHQCSVFQQSRRENNPRATNSYHVSFNKDLSGVDRTGKNIQGAWEYYV